MNRQNITSLTFFYPTQYQYLVMMKMAQIKTHNLSHGSNKLLVLQLLLLVGAVCQGWCLEFSYPSFPQEVEQDFERSGEAYIVGDALQVTRDNRDSIHNLSGRILYKKPIILWKEGHVATFNSTFVLNVTPESNPPGDGRAFIMTKDMRVPDNSSDQWLGIVNPSTNGSSASRIVAVETKPH